VVSKVGADADPGGPAPMRLAQRPEQLRAGGDQVVDLDDQMEVMVAMHTEGLIGGIGLSSVSADVLRRAMPAGIACVQNAYSLVARQDEEMLALCASHDIAWVPYFPLGGAVPGLPKVTEQSAAQATARSLGASTSQVGLAWLLAHDPGVLLIPDTADPEHLQANLAAGSLTLDGATMAVLDALASPSAQTPTG